METLDELIPAVSDGARMWSIVQDFPDIVHRGNCEWRVRWQGRGGVYLDMTGRDLHTLLRIFLRTRDELLGVRP